MVVYMKYLEITEDNHKPALDELNKHAKNGGESVVALTAPWCGHCKAMKPELKKMRSKLKGGNGIVANVSDKYHAQLDMDTQVDGFPTVRHFKGGKKVRDYEGERVASDLANFANNSLNSAGAVQVGGGKRKKTRRRLKRGAGGAKVSKVASNNTSKKNNSAMIVGGIEIGNNTARNDIEYVTLYNIILGRLEEYSNSGLGSNRASYSVNNDWSIPRAIKELKQNRARTRELLLDIATLISSYNLDLQDNEVLAIAFYVYIALVGGEQYDDGTDIQRMLGLLAYGKDYYDGNNFRHDKPVQPRKLSKTLKKIFIEITTTGDRGSLQSQIRRKVMGLNSPHSNKNSSVRGASKSNKGGRRKKTRRKKRKTTRKKKRKNKKGGGLCASSQRTSCENMVGSIETRQYLPNELKSAPGREPANVIEPYSSLNDPPLLRIKIGRSNICFKIGEGWLGQDTTPVIAVILWLNVLAEEHNWKPPNDKWVNAMGKLVNNIKADIKKARDSN